MKINRGTSPNPDPGLVLAPEEPLTRQQFEALARKLEKAAESGMSSYRRKVLLLATAGYVYIFVVLAVVLATLALLVGALLSNGLSGGLVKLGIPFGALAFTILRALWVRWPDPEGIPLTPQQAPKLFSEVDSIRRKLNAPKVHRIFIDDRFNAAMEQRPILGVFGWTQGYMHVGLPLMLATSTAEFRAVLAHEMGHLSGNHGRSTGWVYRIRRTWSQLLYRLQEEGRWGSGVFTKFFQWYAPFLNAYSFVLARAQEYEADQCAAEVAGREIAARALVAIEVRGRFLDEQFWAEVWKTANESQVPPDNIFLRQGNALRNAFPIDLTQRWLRQSLSTKTGYVDTHPSLSDRLRALGIQIKESDWVSQLQVAGKPTAAEQMLGKSLDSWFQELHKRWFEAARAAWKDRHEEVHSLSQRLAALKERSAESSLDEEESWELARLSRDLEGDRAALPLYQELVRSNLNHVSANFEVGRILLLQGESSGIDHLERAMEADPECTFSACSMVERYLREQDEPTEADRYYNRGMDFLDASADADAERQNITASDTFLPHGLEPSVVKETADHLRRYMRLKSAFLVRKSVQHLPGRPAYVLGIVTTRAWYQFSNSQDDADLVNLIAQQTPLPVGTYVILLSNKELRQRIQAVAGARFCGN